MPVAWLILALVALQRLGELVLARRNTARLLAAGGVEHGRNHYFLFVVLHASWLLTIAVAVDPAASVSWSLLAVFVLLQLARIWVVHSLGRYWTTRIIDLPGAPLVRKGPYRWLRHPNYWVVAGEIVTLPLAFGLPWTAGIFSVLNASLLLYRVRVEDAALAKRHVR